MLKSTLDNPQGPIWLLLYIHFINFFYVFLLLFFTFFWLLLTGAIQMGKKNNINFKSPEGNCSCVL